MDTRALDRQAGRCDEGVSGNRLQLCDGSPGAVRRAENFFDESLVHLHVPEGATPKDGPSAGVTMATALLSLARNQKLGRPLAMTGELTLTGQVLAVGGIREKVIAAKRAGIKELILPEPCRRDFEELPAHIRKGLKVHFAQQYQDVFDVVFGKKR
jgi:ATP-dependent Lon protease